MPPEVILKAKQLGFSDKQIALAVQRWVNIPNYCQHFRIICSLQTRCEELHLSSHLRKAKYFDFWFAALSLW